MEFKEFADEWMKQFFMEPSSSINCQKMGRLVYAYLWAHPEFDKHREDIETFWAKVGEAWDSIEDEYNKTGKL